MEVCNVIVLIERSLDCIYVYMYVQVRDDVCLYSLSSCSGVKATSINRYHSNYYTNKTKCSKIIDLKMIRMMSISNQVKTKDKVRGEEVVFTSLTPTNTTTLISRSSMVP